MDLDLKAGILILAVGVPALTIFFGGMLLLLGYPINNQEMINNGNALILGGGLLFVTELIVYIIIEYLGSQGKL